jgi:hypothetical protein
MKKPEWIYGVQRLQNEIDLIMQQYNTPGSTMTYDEMIQATNNLEEMISDILENKGE